jgi:hypothetical protein
VVCRLYGQDVRGHSGYGCWSLLPFCHSEDKQSPILVDTLHRTGECDQNPTASDNYTKVTLTVRATTTLAQFNAWAAQGTYVLASQDVAQGWIVYFTDTPPLVMDGVSYTMPATSINLTTIQANPASTTFFVYAQLVAGVPSYLITTTHDDVSGHDRHRHHVDLQYQHPEGDSAG